VYIEDGPTAGCPNDVGQSPDYDCPNREPERMPRTRLRHAVAVGINQHIPRTRTTLKVGYRFYDDDFDLRAHTPYAMLYQWLGRRVYRPIPTSRRSRRTRSAGRPWCTWCRRAASVVRSTSMRGTVGISGATICTWM
jgi:hypothetical protein